MIREGNTILLDSKTNQFEKLYSICYGTEHNALYYLPFDAKIEAVRVMLIDLNCPREMDDTMIGRLVLEYIRSHDKPKEYYLLGLQIIEDMTPKLLRQVLNAVQTKDPDIVAYALSVLFKHNKEDDIVFSKGDTEANLRKLFWWLSLDAPAFYPEYTERCKIFVQDVLARLPVKKHIYDLILVDVPLLEKIRLFSSDEEVKESIRMRLFLYQLDKEKEIETHDIPFTSEQLQSILRERWTDTGNPALDIERMNKAIQYVTKHPETLDFMIKRIMTCPLLANRGMLYNYLKARLNFTFNNKTFFL